MHFLFRIRDAAKNVLIQCWLAFQVMFSGPLLFQQFRVELC